MSEPGAKERDTQERIIKLLVDRCRYTYLGNKEHETNTNIDTELLTKHLAKEGYEADLIQRAIFKLQQAANNQTQTLYNRNEAVYKLLRYGVQVQPADGGNNTTVALINWQNPQENDFYVAEEVTVAPTYPDGHSKRPDLVIYINGIAITTIELKRSTVSVSEGIRQTLDNQKRTFIEGFFSTIQWVIAGNDTEGLRYATIQTPEKYWLKWKEPTESTGNPLDTAIAQILNKDRFIELLYDYIVYDAGVKKLCRPHQYFGVKAAQQNVAEQQGGIIWHTQGSGKSLTMVWLARWILENVEDGRVLIVTDREELDSQIESVFQGVGESIYRTSSGSHLIEALAGTLNVTNYPSAPSLICSLVHKFGSTTDTDAITDEIVSKLPAGFKPTGNFVVFVDEAHRTQSGDLHDAMKKVLPNATFIGFTGTPLLSADKARSVETFGPYIHTYKYDEAVTDGVVLDLRYEARDIDQRITSQAKIDQWFDSKTKELNDNAKASLKRRWGTMQQVMSSKTRLNAIVSDIVLDMSTRPRLMSGRGNAILVASSVYDACRYYELFSETELAGKIAIITSYTPSVDDIKGEAVGEGETDAIEKYETYQKMLATWFNTTPEKAVGRVDEFETQAKERFIKQPGQLKLLIVVDKLLTGFDAPPATYLYIDKQMRDHGLFQAICRVNRLDETGNEEDRKEYGYIVDYKDLFASLKTAVVDYTSESFDNYDKSDVEGLLKDRLSSAKKHLDEVREQVKALCEPVKAPKGTENYIDYFCPNSELSQEQIAAREKLRVTLYRLVGTFTRAWAEIANEASEAGYTDSQIDHIKKDVKHYDAVKQELLLASGDGIDLKAYEPGMRYLIDTYIKSDDSEKISDFDNLGFLELLINNPGEAVTKLPNGGDKKSAAAVIENNVRKVIVDKNSVNPRYYEKMSALLAELVAKRKQDAIDYKAYLKEIAKLAEQVLHPERDNTYPATLATPAERALYDLLDSDEAAALCVHTEVLNSRQYGWRDNAVKKKRIANAVGQALTNCGFDQATYLEQVMALLVAQSEY